jgi:hypothetical protein
VVLSKFEDCLRDRKTKKIIDEKDQDFFLKKLFVAIIMFPLWQQIFAQYLKTLQLGLRIARIQENWRKLSGNLSKIGSASLEM